VFTGTRSVRARQSNARSPLLKFERSRSRSLPDLGQGWSHDGDDVEPLSKCSATEGRPNEALHREPGSVPTGRVRGRDHVSTGSDKNSLSTCRLKGRSLARGRWTTVG
jgi:hypothetical protein